MTRALILSLCVCYHSRLQSRADYEEEIVKYFKSPLELCDDGVKQFQNEILWCVQNFKKIISGYNQKVFFSPGCMNTLP